MPEEGKENKNKSTTWVQKKNSQFTNKEEENDSSREIEKTTTTDKGSKHNTDTDTDQTTKISNYKNYDDDEIYLQLPEELKDIDYTYGISWGKYAPYINRETGKMYPPLPLTTEASTNNNSTIQFTKKSPALKLEVHATSGRARACTIQLPHGPVETPVFMPVGTKGTIKGLVPEEIVEEIGNQIILANTYHLALEPGTELIREIAGTLHTFMNWNRNLLTDSGGFQMVSLLKLSEVTEEGVIFQNPFDKEKENEKERKKSKMLLRPEDSINHQNNIGADIIMALDDVVSSVNLSDTRFRIATFRTLRWLDRCFQAHQNPRTQNLFPICQGGLDTQKGGLREMCLAGFRNRDLKRITNTNTNNNENNKDDKSNSIDEKKYYDIPGFAIGGLAGGEDKDDFWKVVNLSCEALPDLKPRYLMGVGYPLDLVICTALGVDMYDCVYPTRTARFGVALVGGKDPGTIRLRGNEFLNCTEEPILKGCTCVACRGYNKSTQNNTDDDEEKKSSSSSSSHLYYSKARIHQLLKSNNALAAQLITHHNLVYMKTLTKNMRDAIIDGKYDEFCIDFVMKMFPGEKGDDDKVPKWVRDALNAAGIQLP